MRRLAARSARYALREDRTAFFFVFESQNQIAEAAHDLATQKQILRDTFSREAWIEWPEIESHMEACGDLYFDAVSQITLPRWSEGRTALVGDAAYCPSLLAGEGAAFAMAGAYILAAELDRAGGDYQKPLEPMSGASARSSNASKNRPVHLLRALRRRLRSAYLCEIRYYD